MKRIPIKDTEGNTHYRFVPETEEERRQLTRRAHLASGGIDERDEAPEDDDEWSDE